MEATKKLTGNSAKNREIHGENNVWHIAQPLKQPKNLILMFGLNITTDHLAMANSAHWHSHVFRMEDGYVLRKPSELMVEGKRKKRRQKGTWKKQVEGEGIKVEHNSTDR